MKSEKIALIGCTGLIIFCISMLMSSYGIWGLISYIIKGISGFVLVAAFICETIKIILELCKDKYKVSGVLKRIMKILFFVIFSIFGLCVSVKLIYDASLDLINRELVTVNINKVECNVKYGGKAGKSYYIRGINKDKREVEFSIEKKTYKNLKNKRENLQITYYKKSRVIYSIK